MVKKKALCCGLNYPNQKFPLYGSVNDCLDWEQLFRSVFNFDETRVLIDQNPDGTLCNAPTQIPTRANILAQLGWLCSGNEQGDVLVFVFAGHGCQVRGANGQIDEALVPEDYGHADGQGPPPLVMDDELHALFSRLPAGSFLTVVLDCCHGSRMLDVPTSVDTSQRPARALHSMEPVREILNRSGDAWQKALMPHAQARPRFVPTAMSGPRKKRTPDGHGAHLGRQTLDPGVTAFCFAASRSPESAFDASIKSHQRGVMSFCLLEALSSLDNKCTYQMLLDAAAAKMDDIRDKYMPDMDQHIQLSYCPNSTPDQVVCFDEQYATRAQYVLGQQSQRSVSGDPGYMYNGGAQGPGRVPSTDFVPSPANTNQPPAGQPPAGQPPPQHHHGHHGGAHSSHAPAHASHHHAHGPILYLIVHRGLGLRIPMGETSELFTMARLGKEERRTPPTSIGQNPVWTSDNQFTFHVNERDTVMQLEIHSAKYPQSECIARSSLDVRSLQPREWLRRRERLSGTDGELEFDVRLELGSGTQQPQPQPQAQPQHMGPPGPQPTEGGRAPSPEDARRPPSPAAYRTPGEMGAPPDYGFGAGSTPGMDMSPPIPACGGIFGTPNLFGAMPNLLSALSGGASTSAGLSTGAVSAGGYAYAVPGVQQPVTTQVPMGAGGMPAGFGSTLGASPGRGLSGQLTMPYATPQASAGLAAPWSPGPQLSSQISPQMPTATMGIDLNQNGRADLMVQGPDLNYNGIPDALEPALYGGEPTVYGTGSRPMYRTAMSGGSYMLPPVSRVVTAGVAPAAVASSPMMVAGGQRSTAVLNARN
jgi:hypothetical protein